MGKRVSELRANPKNPRKVTDGKLSQLKKSMREYGDLSGIVFNQLTGNLVSGHQRSKQFDKTTKVVITKTFPKLTDVGTKAVGYILHNGERFNYREVVWDADRELAGMIAANKNAGEWETPELIGHLKHLGSFDVDFDLDLTMFDANELSEMGVLTTTVKEHERTNPTTGVDEDEVPEKAEARTKAGDVYELGAHRLLCGDSTSKDDVEKLMGGKRAIAAITDPPYSVNYENQERKPGTGTRKGRGDAYRDPKSALDLLTGMFSSLPTDVLVMSYPFDKHFRALGTASEGWDLLYELVWVKHHFAFCIGKRYQQQHEPILIFRREKGESFFDVPSNQSTVFEYAKAAKNPDHPTPKPVELYERLVSYQSDVGQVVFEPFCGSGTTVIACEKTNRKCFAMEIDPSYCDIIVARWEKYTGKKAKLVPRVKTITRKKSSKQV